MVSDYDIKQSLYFCQDHLARGEFNFTRSSFTHSTAQTRLETENDIYLLQNTERLLSNIQQRGRDYVTNMLLEYLER